MEQKDDFNFSVSEIQYACKHLPHLSEVEMIALMKEASKKGLNLIQYVDVIIDEKVKKLVKIYAQIRTKKGSK